MLCLGLLSDDTEWFRCMQDTFSSNFDRLTEVFSIIMVFLRMSNPLRIRARTKNLMMADFRRRHREAVLNEEFPKNYALNEIQNPLTEISPALTLESLNLLKPPERSYHAHIEDTDRVVSTQSLESMELNTKKLNEGQENVLNTMVDEILPGITAENLFAPVQRPFHHQSSYSRAYFLDADEGAGKTFTFRGIQSLSKIHKHTRIAVATSAVVASLLEDGRTVHSVSKIPIPCYAESVCNINLWIPELPTRFASLS